MLRVLFLLVLLLGGVASASAQPLPGSAPVPPIAAKSWLLYDYTARREIAAGDRDERIEPASLTKLMDAYVAFSAIKQGKITLQQAVIISERAKSVPGSRMYVSPQLPATIDQLLHGLIIQSGNDAAVALAEAIAGSEPAFVERMNDEARRLGMTGTRFANVTGLSDPKHYSTVGDLLKLAVALISEFPDYYPLFGQKEYSYAGVAQHNRNELLFRDPYVDGMKTGHTEAAGFCLIASAKRESRRLIAIVVGTASESARAIEAQKLLNYGFEYWEGIKLYAAGAAVTTLPVWKGSTDHLQAGFVQDFYVSVPRGQAGMLKAKVESLQPLLAPIAQRQPVGVLKLSFADRPYGEFPIMALEDVTVANLAIRAWHSLRLMFK
jgi:D-alanyl-D-alanine carboxypeptidase (penicillin-binding protein 5/6)